MTGAHPGRCWTVLELLERAVVLVVLLAGEACHEGEQLGIPGEGLEAP
jgi:hypothetical protein